MIIDNLNNDEYSKTHLINLNNHGIDDFEFLKNNITFVFSTTTDELINEAIYDEKIKTINLATDKKLKTKLINKLNVPLDDKIKHILLYVTYDTNINQNNYLENLTYILKTINLIPIYRDIVYLNSQLNESIYTDILNNIKQNPSELSTMLAKIIINEEYSEKFINTKLLLNLILLKLGIKDILIERKLKSYTSMFEKITFIQNSNFLNNEQKLKLVFKVFSDKSDNSNFKEKLAAILPVIDSLRIYEKDTYKKSCENLKFFISICFRRIE